MDFDLAKKHSKEYEQRRKDAKRKLDQQKRDDEQRSIMEKDQRARDEVRQRAEDEARRKAAQEVLLNDGVRYVARLRPYPSTRTDDKLELPPSALEDLEQQGAIERGTLLTFAVSVPSSSSGSSPARTHAGVAEFTAEEGTVGVPPRVALCLTKGSGLDSLAAVDQVEVRYFRLPRSSKSRVKLQPRGEGFHVSGMKTAHIDLQHVLQETLRGHTALTEGDWLPIRHDGYTYELMVRELEPEPYLALLDTDLTVEVLPSERTEAELRAEEEKKAREEAAAHEAEERERLRLNRARAKALLLGPEPEAAADLVQIMVRLPLGGRLSRRFKRDTAFEQVLDWVESEPDSRVTSEEFRLVQKWPGHCRELGPAEAGQELGKLNFARQEALFLQHLKSAATEMGGAEDMEGVTEDQAPERAAPPSLVPAGGGEWAAAEERAHEALDRRLDGRPDTPTAALKEGKFEELKGVELVSVFDRLRALGMPPPEAAATAKKYAAQLKELGEMGFEDWITAARLLEKYNGRLSRVANLLSEGGGAEFDDFPMAPVAPAAAPAPVTFAVPVPEPAQQQRPQATTVAVASAAAGIDKERVAAKFRELLAAGVQPNDAAGQAIQHVRHEMAAEAASDPSSDRDEVMPPAEDPGKLAELASMGFGDEDRNRVLLRKYGGRMERVIEALCS